MNKAINHGLTLTFLIIGAAGLCGITEHPSSREVFVDSTVELRCSVDQKSQVIDWLFGDDGDDSIKLRGGDLGGNYEYREDDGTLIINNFKASNAGLYRCVVESDGGLCVSKPAKLLYFNSELNLFRIKGCSYIYIVSCVML